MTSVISLSQLNELPVESFTATLGSIFEHSPWIAARAHVLRPFSSRLQLLEAMLSVIQAASREEQLALICAHPDLAGKAAIRNQLTPESTREQRGAGLDACTPEQFARLQALNAEYRARFGFPFILAVRGHTSDSVIAAMAQRMAHEPAAEHATALQQIGLIGGYRLADAVSNTAGAEIMAMLHDLGLYSEDAQGLTCSYLSAVHGVTAARLREWMLGAGLHVHTDAVGNVVGRWCCGRSDAKTLMTGSHYDTVVNGGKYDGRLGIVVPIVVAQQLRQQGRSLPFDLEILAFSDEEGVRFKTTFIGSGAIAGQFDARILDNTDAAGVTMRAALQSAGLDPTRIPSLARDPARQLGYVEIHIEQGPVLLNAQQALGVVTGIAGSVRYLVTITGLAGHAGTVPMGLRRDAAAAAAEVILAVEGRCARTPGVVGTVGQLNVPGGAINVIPGRCELSIDMRAGADATRDAAVADVVQEIEQIAARRNVEIRLDKVMQAAAAPCTPSMQARLARSITRVTGEREPRHLPSGAGHDAMKMAALTEIGMLFVRCGNGGISHHPDETMTLADAETTAAAFTDFLTSFQDEPTPQGSNMGIKHGDQA
jgi:allantoate deiminase/N-carbamoyl-L-amino-acid hydrolase